MPNEWIELGLSRSVAAPRHDTSAVAPPPAASTLPTSAPALPGPAATFIVELLDVISDMAPDATGLKTDVFRESLAACGARMGSDPRGLTALAGECVTMCHAFLGRAKAHLAERETEFSELIAVLTEMVTTLGGGDTFNDQLERTTERLN